MAKVGAQRAAELTGKSKSTIQRAMNSGKLSYEMDTNKRRIVDVSELERVFGLNNAANNSAGVSNGAAQAELEKAKQMLEMERLQMRIKVLEDQLDVANKMVEDLKDQRDNWQRQAQQVLLTSQHSQKQADEFRAELKAREEQAKKRREQMMEQRMKKLQGQNQNDRAVKKAGHAKVRETQKNQGESATQSGGFEFKSLWAKIKGTQTDTKVA
ncbi:MAG: entry exclusion 1 domain-containing protein [Alphaproteobacteria bacterium]|nr:entry exclusion 1 domain-containing protein [Alphaproteobacteria bacterium]